MLNKIEWSATTNEDGFTSYVFNVIKISYPASKFRGESKELVINYLIFKEPETTEYELFLECNDQLFNLGAFPTFSLAEHAVTTHQQKFIDSCLVL